MSKHTPGPWWNSGLDVGTAPTMQVKTAVADGSNYEEAVANARLIAQAPALAAALRPFARFACDQPCGCHNCVARAVLAKVDA